MHRLFASLSTGILLLATGFSGVSVADMVSQDGRALIIERPDLATTGSLLLLGPNGKQAQIEFGNDEAFHLNEARIRELGLPDGRYTFEMRFSHDISVDRRANPAEPGENSDLSTALPSLHPASGDITIKQGRVIADLPNEFEDQVVESTGRDQVINDNLIVTGGTCLGFDCASPEVFQFDTLRLKENNARLTFIDTSDSSSNFPAGDWQLRANDSSPGGADHFSLDWLGVDAANGTFPETTPFRVDGSAPSNALRISSTGQIGLNTAAPLRDLHLAVGNTPTHRFEQTGEDGFTPQIWDIGANEANFFIRDVSTNDQLPFRVRPGAPTSSIDVNASGNVGIGTGSPSARLHVSDGDLRVDGAVYQLSSRALKTEFVHLDPGALLDRLSRLNLGFWHYLERPNA